MPYYQIDGSTVETFYLNRVEARQMEEGLEAGWFYWPCFPGCLPDGEAMGPFETEEEALEDAREAAP